MVPLSNFLFLFSFFLCFLSLLSDSLLKSAVFLVFSVFILMLSSFFYCSSWQPLFIMILYIGGIFVIVTYFTSMTSSIKNKSSSLWVFLVFFIFPFFSVTKMTTQNIGIIYSLEYFYFIFIIILGLSFLLLLVSSLTNKTGMMLKM